MTNVSDNGIDFQEFWFDLRNGRKRLDDFADDVVKRATELSHVGRSELQAFFDTGVARETTSPKPGSKAPDFQLERLDAKGKQTGESVQLARTLDKPVALVFGSYT
ncbi:MAG: hypothetical protein OES38_03510 [Gammaproteobacteria bacterium]|nr:hypothetical protein [Gammaproteobacteria bacterium]